MLSRIALALSRYESPAGHMEAPSRGGGGECMGEKRSAMENIERSRRVGMRRRRRLKVDVEQAEECSSDAGELCVSPVPCLPSHIRTHVRRE